MAKRTYPNSYFAWYNDDKRLAIVCQDTTAVSGERTIEEYDTFQGDGDLSGTITNMLTDGSTVTVTCSAAHGLAESDRIRISGTRHYDGDYAVASTPTSTTFTFASSALAGAADTITDLDVASETKVATVTCSANHGYSVGDVVYIDASSDSYDEQVTITATNGTNQFNYVASLGTIADLTGTVGDTGSFISLFVDNGLRITYHSKYETVSTSNLTSELSSAHGLDTGMQSALVCYVKARMFEDTGDIQRAQYYRQMYEKSIKQYPSRKSGVRTLAVPKL